MATSSARKLTDGAVAAKPAVKKLLDTLAKQNPALSKSALKTVDSAVTAIFTAAGQLSQIQQRQIAAHEKDLTQAVRDAFSQFASGISLPSDRMSYDRKIPVERSQGEGLGKLLSKEEGLRRLEQYAVTMRLEDWAGPVAGPVELQNRYGIKRSTLHDWQKRGLVIGLLKGGRKHAFPLAQFVDGRPIKGIAEVNSIIGDARTTWLWLLRSHPETDQTSPLEYLKAGRVEEVLRAAEQDHD